VSSHFKLVTGSETLASSFLPASGQFINGKVVPSHSSETIEVLDPATEKVITRVARGNQQDVDDAVKAARAAAKTWGKTVPKDRADVLNAIADRIQELRDEFIALEALDTGKPIMVSEIDIDLTIDCFRFFAGAARAFTTMGGGQYVADNTSVILREPVGVVGVITPWNYPIMMAAWKLGPILGGGNTAIIKPSEITPLTTLKLAEVIADLVPAGVVNIVTGTGSVVGNALSSHPGIDLVALTGSVNSGRLVAESAGSTLKRVHLELGGKAPVIVYADADLEAAAAGIRTAGYWNSGQECGAGCRVIVHESVAEEFTKHLVREVGTLVVGSPSGGSSVEIGPVVSKAHFDRVMKAIDLAKEQGATVALGGHGFEEDGYYIAPTVLTNVSPTSSIATEEAFGPVVSVETFSDAEEVIERANATVYGLSASVWTTDAKTSIKAPQELDFGTVWVNSHLILANEVPWGGFKGSGYGRDLSVYALEDFTRTKHVMINHA
jgi:aminobutyraldehyde dehydrogenase